MKLSCKDMIPNAKFGNLTIIERLPRDDKGVYRVICLCACGKKTVPCINNIVNGNVKSCGCLPRGKFNHKIIPGVRFGRLTIIHRLPPEDGKYRKHYRILCKCDCGKETTPEISCVTSGAMISCGCYRQENMKTMARVKAATAFGTGQVFPGAKFSRLTVIHRIEKDGKLTDHVACVCDCGNKTLSEIDSLWRGLAKSCGCLQSELLTQRNRDSGKYNGFSVDHPETFSIWQGVIRRCFNKNSLDYQRYGARGITMCHYLRDNPQNLVELVNFRPSKKHSLDRYPKNDGNYSCGKCEECFTNNWELNIRWATYREQSLNRGDYNVQISAFGMIKTKSQWIEVSGLSWSTFHNRLKRNWPIEKALTTPDKKGNCYHPERQAI